MKKGLRHRIRIIVSAPFSFKRGPDEEGIETRDKDHLLREAERFKRGPDEEGIETIGDAWP